MVHLKGFYANKQTWLMSHLVRCTVLLGARRSKTLLWCPQVLKSSLKVLNRFILFGSSVLKASCFLVPTPRKQKTHRFLSSVVLSVGKSIFHIFRVIFTFQHPQLEFKNKRCESSSVLWNGGNQLALQGIIDTYG